MHFSPSVPRAHHTILGKSAVLFEPQCFVYGTVFQPPLLIFGSREDHGAGKDWRQREKRETENEMVGWHQQFNGHELGQTLEDSGTGRPGVLQPMGSEQLGVTWRLNNIMSWGGVGDSCPVNCRLFSSIPISTHMLRGTPPLPADVTTKNVSRPYY